MRDLRDARWMYLKALLFVVIGCVSACLLLLAVPTLQGALYLGLAIWAFCRAYYFAFYVIERYIDPAYKFSGLLSALRFILNSRRPGP